MRIVCKPGALPPIVGLRMRKFWVIPAVIVGGIGIGGLGILGQSSLSPVYTTADAWDCAGGSSCPKPIGTIDGKNATFSLRGAPSGPASVDVYLNGVRERIGADYNLSGASYQALTFTSPPALNDTIDIRYRENTRANVLPQ